MSYIFKRVTPKGTISWLVQFRKKEQGKMNIKSYSFATKKEAKDFAEKWEYTYLVEGPEAIPERVTKRAARLGRLKKKAERR